MISSLLPDPKVLGFYPVGDLNWYWSAPGQYNPGGDHSQDPHHYDSDLTCETYPDNSPDKCITKCIMTWPKYHKAPGYNLATHQCRDEASFIYITCFQDCFK